MEADLKELRVEVNALIAAAASLPELEAVRVDILGKKGRLKQILRGMGGLAADERPVIGKLANELNEHVEAELERRREELLAVERERQMRAERIDVTLPGRMQPLGRLHPLSAMARQICDIFTSLGFQIAAGPEVETEWYNFVALNIPEGHPARDDHDSFYVDDEVLLRTETSAVQIRTMEQMQPPVRIIAPGRVYRRDDVDSTHSHTFHQVEGLLVDEDVTFGDLKGTLMMFAKRMYGDDVKCRFRPHYFPFTEPSAEMDISCAACHGAGCRVCGGTGWVEVLGSGMVHPKVLENVGYDTEKVRGFAFGMGIDRLTMMKYGIDDIRLFFENDLRFLEQL